MVVAYGSSPFVSDLSDDELLELQEEMAIAKQIARNKIDWKICDLMRFILVNANVRKIN